MKYLLVLMACMAHATDVTLSQIDQNEIQITHVLRAIKIKKGVRVSLKANQEHLQREATCDERFGAASDSAQVTEEMELCLLAATSQTLQDLEKTLNN